MNFMIDHLLNLPEDLFKNSVARLLSLRDLARLDAATNNVKQREDLKNRMLRSLVTCSPPNRQLDIQAFRWLFDRKVLLENLVLAESVADDALPILLHVAPRSINAVLNANKLSLDGTLRLLHCCSRLESLTLSGRQYSEEVFKSIVAHADTLRSLAICDNETLSDDILISLFEDCKQLRSVYLRTCKLITNTAIVAMVTTVTQLESVRLSELERLTNSAITTIAQYGKRLKSFNLCNCKGVNGEAVMEVAQNCVNLEDFGVLVCARSNNNVLQTLSMHCANLHTVHLSECQIITDAAVTLFSRSFPRLKDLTFFDAKQLTDKGVTALAQNCREMTSVFIAHSELLTEISIVALATFCPQIECLYVTEITMVSDAALQAVAGLTSLQCLCVSPCTQVSDVGMQALAGGCRYLRGHHRGVAAGPGRGLPPPAEGLPHAGGQGVCRLGRDCATPGHFSAQSLGGTANLSTKPVVGPAQWSTIDRRAEAQGNVRHCVG
jgi:hypothetical protein